MAKKVKYSSINSGHQVKCLASSVMVSCCLMPRSLDELNKVDVIEQ